MKKLSLATVIGMVTTVGVLASASSNAAMDPYVEKALQQVCYSSTSDRLYSFKKTVKSYRLDVKDVAMKVVCNGEDIATFAAENGAMKTANYIRSHQDGEVQIQELVHVTVPIKPKA